MESLIEDSASYQVISKCKTSRTSREELYSELHSSEQDISSALQTLTQQGILDNVQVGEKDLFLLKNNIEVQIFYNTWKTINVQRNTVYNSLSKDYNFPVQEVKQQVDEIVEKYVNSYLENYQRSTLRRMCIEDFIRALEVKTNFKNSNNLEEALLEELSRYERPKRPYDFI